MNGKNNWKLSTQQIQIFLKAVELGNFRMAADFFNYSPSVVSKTILALEEELGVTLFVRGPHELTPTAAAKQLAEEWRLLLGTINNSILRARKRAQDSCQRIVIGFVDSSENLDRKMKKIIREYTGLHPNIRITAEKHDMHRAAELLNTGMLDVIYTSATEVPYLAEHDLRWEPAQETRVVAYVPEESPLFARETLEFADLRNAELTALDPLMHPTYTAWLYELCGASGFSPKIVSTFRTVRSLKFSLTLNPQVFIGESVTQEWENEELKKFVFPNRSFTLLAWRSNEKPEILVFKDFVKNHLR